MCNFTLGKLACWFLSFSIMMFVFAGFFGGIGGGLFAAGRKYWKTQCNVTACVPSFPSYDKVTFESHEHYAFSVSEDVKNGCKRHPIGTSATCYVNSFSLEMKNPVAPGVALLNVTGVFIFVGIGLLLAFVHIQFVRSIKKQKFSLLSAAPAIVPIQPSNVKEDQ